MKIIILTSLTILISCSSTKDSTQQSMLSNRDCNPESARFCKDYVQKGNQLNSVAFDHCSKADDNTSQPYEIKRSQLQNSTKSNALMHKCEVEVSGSNYAVSNKSRINAKERVIKKCYSVENNKKCSNVRCSDL